ncbi:MAG: hypothetical protein A2X59_08165 [Nitrospirae bacterium GWC2_42_7]|nr:MAG: hypothetical protein A2X59_08165 [Nitrospirae bacterium GWC2_42_7]
MKPEFGLEFVTCNLCESDKVLPFMTATDWFSQDDGQFSIVKCKECGLIYVNPRPHPDHMNLYYGEKYYTHGKAKTRETVSRRQQSAGLKKIAKSALLAHVQKDNNSQNKILNQMTGAVLLALFRNKIISRQRWGLVGKKGTLLDVGCGNGSFILGIHNDWLLDGKIKGVGTDIDSAAVDEAKNNEIDASIADSGTLPYQDRSFDIITMKHSLEHMHNPLKTLREAWRVTKDGGYIIIEVPNIESLGPRLFRDKWSAIDAPRHLYHFNPATLSLLVSKAGFDIEDIYKWKGSYKRDLTLKNLNKEWEKRNFSRLQKILLNKAYSIGLILIELIYRGGAISIRARKN